MAMWDKLFRKKDEDSAKLNPIVQRNPMPAAAPRASAARPAPKTETAAGSAEPAKGDSATKVREKPETRLPKQDQETKSRKQKGEGGTKTRTRPVDDAALVKRGLLRQSKGDHDGAIADFTEAIGLNPDLPQAYASRGVSKEAKGDGAGAKSDYSKSIQLEIMGEINRQMRDNPAVDM